MTQFAAFLSTNKNISKPMLKEALEYLGFSNISVSPDKSYITFAYWMKSKKSLAWHIERILREKYGCNSQATIKTMREFKSSVS